MGQYRPAYEVGGIVEEGRRDAGQVRYASINRPSAVSELDMARTIASDAGLWRFDERNGASFP